MSQFQTLVPLFYVLGCSIIHSGDLGIRPNLFLKADFDWNSENITADRVVMYQIKEVKNLLCFANSFFTSSTVDEGSS